MRIILLVICVLITGCSLNKSVVTPNPSDFEFMNMSSEKGKVIVVPPEELRALREMVVVNKGEIEKLKVSVKEVDAKADKALEKTSFLAEMMNRLWVKVDDCKEAMNKMFEKLMKK